MSNVTRLNDVHDALHARPARGTVLHLPRAAEPREFDSAQLLRGERELRIRHGNEIYRLRHTRNDKLILTK